MYLKYGAEDGFRDDCVMTLAIALYYALQIPSRIPSLGSARKAMSNSITGY